MLALSYVHRWLLSQKLRNLKSSRVYQKESVLQQTWIFFILVTSSGNKHQRDYRFIDSFYTKNFQMSKRNRLQANRNFPVLMMPIRHKHQRDFGLMVGSFHKNLKIHVNNSLNRDNQRSNKHKFPCFDDVIAE